MVKLGNKPNPDNRKDNVKKIQRNIDNTIKNMELAEDMMRQTSSEKTKNELEEKNKKREKALEGMRGEIRDEAIAREKTKD